MKYDVAVVGGGPIGGFTAGIIAEKGFKTAIFEKNKQIGIPLNCAGLVTERILNMLPFLSKKVVLNRIKGANIHSPSGNILHIGGDKVHGIVIDRTNFDYEIIKHSEENGLDVYSGNKIISAQRNNNHIELVTSQNKIFQSNLLIGADGPFSQIRDRFALNPPQEFLIGLGAELNKTNMNPDFVEIYLGRNVAPDFFAWIIPTNKDGSEARMGLCIQYGKTPSAKYYLSKFIESKETKTFLGEAKIIKKIGGVIPLGLNKNVVADHVMIVGDAAAQVKPTSGGGIYSGLLCAKHCGDVAVEAIQNQSFESQFLKEYQTRWMKDIGRELSMGMRFRRIFKTISDKQFDKYIEKFKNPKIIEIINNYGDIDYPSKLLKPLLKKAPSLISLLPNLIKK